MAAVVTRSHRGHMVRDEAGSGWRVWGESTVGGATRNARSSSTSRCSRRFSSVSDPKHRFRYSHSISVCFSLVLHPQAMLINSRVEREQGGGDS